MSSYRVYIHLIYLSLLLLSIETLQKAKDNGDIYIVEEEEFIKNIRREMQTDSTLLTDTNGNMTTTTPIVSANLVNFDEMISICNSSFSIPKHYYEVFNTTATLPDLVDKTGMCFIRCLFEKSGFIENWKLNVQKIRENIWPAMGDTIEVCEKQGVNETNTCVRAFAMANCLKMRSLVDARNNPL